MREPLRVVFVCTGNICRSPSAHAVLESSLARERARGEAWADRVLVESAGTGSWHAGELPTAATRSESARPRGGASRGGCAPRTSTRAVSSSPWPPSTTTTCSASRLRPRARGAVPRLRPRGGRPPRREDPYHAPTMAAPPTSWRCSSSSCAACRPSSRGSEAWRWASPSADRSRSPPPEGAHHRSS
ncbi:MAG: hypothetical protein V4850_35680 [Myxococcota bacterium]